MMLDVATEHWGIMVERVEMYVIFYYVIKYLIVFYRFISLGLQLKIESLFIKRKYLYDIPYRKSINFSQFYNHLCKL